MTVKIIVAAIIMPMIVAIITAAEVIAADEVVVGKSVLQIFKSAFIIL